MQTVKLDWPRPGVAWLRLSDPERLNAMGDEMAAHFRTAVASLRTSPDLRVVLLSGEGGSFSAGGDLAMLDAKRSRSPEQNRHDMLTFYRSFLDLHELGVPLIAAVHGWAVGAGCCLAAACDLRWADPAARFRVPFLALGLFPGMGTTHFLQQRLGPWAADFLLTGATLDAATAQARGLVTHVSQPGQVVPEALAAAEKLLANGSECTRDLLRLLRGDPESLRAALETEARLQAQSYARPEFAAGLARAQARTQKQ